MSMNKDTLNNELEVVHHGDESYIFILGLVIIGVEIEALIRSSSIDWFLLFIGILLVVFQRIHVVDISNTTLLNYIGIGIPFINIYSKLILYSRRPFTETGSISLKKVIRNWSNEYTSGNEEIYQVKINVDSGSIVLSTYITRAKAVKKSNEIERFLASRYYRNIRS
jgi:hypothetical protein